VNIFLFAVIVVSAGRFSEPAFASPENWADSAEARKFVQARFGDEASRLPFSFVYGGRLARELSKTWKRERAQKKLDDSRTEHTLTFSDPTTGLVVRCVAVEFHDFPAVEWVVYLANKGNRDTPVLAEILPLDEQLTVSSGDKDLLLHYARGGVWAPHAFEPLEAPLAKGASKEFVSAQERVVPPLEFAGGGLSSRPHLPFFSAEGDGRGVTMGIGWSGQWAARFQRTDADGLRLTAGMERTHLKLHPGEEIRTPLVMLLFWKGKFINGQNLFRRLVLKHYTPQKDDGPVTAPLSFANWGDEPASQHLAKIEWSTKHGLPFDVYWIDAGWYGTPEQGAWNANLGNWFLKRGLYPDGMEVVAEAAHKAGKKFLLWFNPGQAVEGTEVFREHPEWLLAPTAETPEFFRTWWLFDYGNPDGLKWMTDRMCNLVATMKVDVFRSDFCHEDPTGFLRPGEEADRQGMREIRFVEGWYSLWDELLGRNPGLIIDNCSGGGRMIDLETMKRSIPLWTSDYQVFATAKITDTQAQTFGSLFWLPISATGGHKPTTYNFRSCMRAAANFGYFSMSPIPDGFPAEWARKTLTQYEAVRKYYYGDFYPLTEYSRDDSVWMAYQMHRPDLDEGLVMAFRRAQSPDSKARFALVGLEAEGDYSIANLDAGAEVKIAGRELLEEGLAVEMQDPMSASVITYRRLSP
jgi:alpha-galactosidase